MSPTARSKTWPWPMRAALVILALWMSRPIAAAQTSDQVEYNRDIRPILSDNCFACHGPDRLRRKAGLSLADPESAHAVLRSGSTAIVPGKPKDSAVIARVSAADDDERMPPAFTGKKLTPAQITTLSRWIEQGGRLSTALGVRGTASVTTVRCSLDLVSNSGRYLCACTS